ncbi:hypothetical protein P7K49_007929 [Saguinus oedipus]|uniref:Potassium channel domain-containing protein n=1 Tax=Saguinus oedipus TaxID=9490 RepID=A0ABQ9VYN3_SAGOE|nr:hypothetical protein P7K49_007929 [Saguinus oedipus]
MEAWVKGVNPKGNSTNPSNWDFGSSFFFAGTVVTTIGYGNLAPSTEAGQVFCVFYALLGIPLNVIFLNHLGTGLRAHLATIERWEDQPRRSQLLRVLGLALFLTLGTLVILIFPPMVFSHVEGWSFGEGFYFAFITLSTIGFGDYVVATSSEVSGLGPITTPQRPTSTDYPCYEEEGEGILAGEVPYGNWRWLCPETPGIDAILFPVRHRPQQALHLSVPEPGSHLDPPGPGVAGADPPTVPPASAQVLPALAAQ